MKSILAGTAACMASLFGAWSASAQVEGEDMASLDAEYANIVSQLPREATLIMTPWVSSLGVVGNTKSELIDDRTVSGKKALRVVGEKRPQNWDIAVEAPIGPAVKKGDLIVLVYYMKLVDGSPNMPFNAVQNAGEPYNTIAGGSAQLTDEWNLFVAQGNADRNYRQNSLKLSLHFGGADNTVDIGPVFVLNLGKKGD